MFIDKGITHIGQTKFIETDSYFTWFVDCRQQSQTRTSRSCLCLCFIFQLDITDDVSIHKAVEHVQQTLNGKHLNCLINNAGIAAKLKFTDINEKDMMETYRQNVIGPWKTIKVDSSIDSRSDSKDNSFLHGLRTRSIRLCSLICFQAFLPLLEKSAAQLKQRDINQSSIVNISTIMSSLELSKSLPYFYYDYQCSKVRYIR
jgi:NAD(P)-dependent dehydrogenase (short-subunit alcohol dehydrogenase family)